MKCLLQKKWPQPTQHVADAALLSVAAIWGTTFVAVKSALADIGPFWFIAIRFALAALVLFLICPRRTLMSVSSVGKIGVTIGVVLFASYLLQTIGLQYTSATNSAFITSLCVVIVPVIGRFWGQKTPSTGAWLGIASAVVGLGMLTIDKNLAFNAGDIFTVFAALAFALHIVLVGYYAPRYDAMALSVLQIAAVAVCGLVGAAMFEPLPVAFSREVWIGLAATAIPATAFAILVQTAMQSYTTSARTALIFSAEPVFAGLFAFLILGEALSMQQWLGCALIVAGMLLSEFS